MGDARFRSAVRGRAAALLFLTLTCGIEAGVRLGVEAAAGAPANEKIVVDEALLGGLRWRAIGPAVVGGRVSDVAGVPGNPNILYVAFASAGLWKSLDGGISFESMFESGNTLSLGAVAVAPDNPSVIYVGTGEGKPRN